MLQDGDFVRGVQRHRALPVRKHALGLLYPEALPERFNAERWMDGQQTTLDPAGRNAFVQWGSELPRHSGVTI